MVRESPKERLAVVPDRLLDVVPSPTNMSNGGMTKSNNRDASHHGVNRSVGRMCDQTPRILENIADIALVLLLDLDRPVGVGFDLPDDRL